MSFQCLCGESHSDLDSDEMDLDEVMKNLLNDSVESGVELLFDGTWHDLRIEEHRAQYFEHIQRGTASIESAEYLLCEGGEPCLLGNVLAFDTLIRRRIFKRIFISIANDPAALFKQMIIIMITLHLLVNRLIIRHVFKETELWKPLLSAQIAVMNCRGVSRFNDPLWWGLMRSMKHWEAKHFVFALNHGLMTIVDREMMTVNRAEMDKEWPAVILGVQIICCIAYFGGKCDYKTLPKDVNQPHKSAVEYLVKQGLHFKSMPAIWEDDREMSPTQFIRNRLKFERKWERECGWPPCAHFNPQKEEKREMKPSFKCKGCKLIRYCCRNHQKKHWKFIHSQQCRAVSMIK